MNRQNCPNRREDCRERIRSSRGVNQETEQIKTPWIQSAEKRYSPGAVYRHDRPHVAKTVEVATGAVHPESAAEH